MADFQWNTDAAYKGFCICLMSGCTLSSLSRNKSAARRICGISEYFYFFFFFTWVRKVLWGRKKEITVVIWNHIYLTDITKVPASLLVEDFAEILFTVFISMPVCDYDWSWRRKRCHVGYKATASHRARVCRLKRPKVGSRLGQRVFFKRCLVTDLNCSNKTFKASTSITKTRKDKL